MKERVMHSWWCNGKVAACLWMVVAGWLAAGLVAVADDMSEAVTRWYGELDATDRRFRFILEHTGDWQLRSLDEGDQRFVVENYRADTERLRFELPISQARYAGNVRADGSVEGVWEQRGQSLPLDFRPVGDTPVPPPAEEVWAGELNATVQKLPLRFRITRDAAGLRTAWMDSPMQKAGGFRGDLGIKDRIWSFDVPAVRGRFEGMLSDDEQTLEGTWAQGGLSFPLTLARAAEDALVQPAVKLRPQTPQPPFPYHSEDVVFRNAAADVTLAGTLTLPEGEGPFPAVVLISGSGPQDRDETLFEHKPFAVLADALTRRGVAVLRYDDRGVGGSSEGSPEATSEDFALDVDAARAFLAARPEIDAARVGLVGHSEGAMVAGIAAARKPGVACVVMLAGAGVDGRQVLLTQGRRVLEAEGVSDPAQLERQRVVQEVLMETVQEAAPGTSLEKMASDAAVRLRQELPEDDPARDDLESFAEAGVARLASPWFRFFLEHDPSQPLQTLSCPVLALVGSKDVQVDAATNLPPLREAVAKAGHPRSVVEELPGLNHLFQTATSGAVSEYDTIEETMAVELLDRVGDWLEAVFGGDS
jgi:pimeloyl-ACP methyl ester carboxylesterase